MPLIDSVYQIMMDNSLEIPGKMFTTLKSVLFPSPPLDQLFKLICFDLGDNFNIVRIVLWTNKGDIIVI